MDLLTTSLASESHAMVPIRHVPRTALDAGALAQVEIIWQMARESLAANDDQIVINPSVYQLIGNSGLEELKFRLR